MNTGLFLRDWRILYPFPADVPVLSRVVSGDRRDPKEHEDSSGHRQNLPF